MIALALDKTNVTCVVAIYQLHGVKLQAWKKAILQGPLQNAKAHRQSFSQDAATSGFVQDLN